MRKLRNKLNLYIRKKLNYDSNNVLEHNEILERKGLYKYYFIIRNLPLVIAKFSNVLVMIFIFFINPSNLFKFSWRGSLPTPKMRDKYKKTFLEIYQPTITKNFEINMENKALFTKGYQKKIKFDKNAILLSHKVTKENRNCIFTTSDAKMLKHYIENDVDVIYNRFLVEDNEGKITDLCSSQNKILSSTKNLKIINIRLKTNNTKFLLGSGIIAIIAFYMISNKLRVYGWNFYQKKSLASMNIIEFIFSIFFFLRDINSRNKVEYSLIHLFFSYYFKETKDLNIYGYLDYYKNNYFDKLITKRLNKIFLK